MYYKLNAKTAASVIKQVFKKSRADIRSPTIYNYAPINVKPQPPGTGFK